MLDIVARILPVAATVAVASLAVFNVGYFWKIGLHFLGTVDFNNIVYSFGLTIGLWMVLNFIGLKWVDIFVRARVGEVYPTFHAHKYGRYVDRNCRIFTCFIFARTTYF
jgi:hypothetical protein